MKARTHRTCNVRGLYPPYKTECFASSPFPFILTPKRNLAISVVFSFVVVVLLSFSTKMLSIPADDDYGIAIALSGLRPDSEFCLFVNAILARFISLLCTLVPGFNWFWLFERIVTFVAVAVLCFLCLELIDSKPFLSCAAAASLFGLLPLCTYYSNFTAVSGISTLAGFSILAYDFEDAFYGKPYRSWLRGIGIALCFIGFLIRYESFLLVMPFAFIVLAVVCWKHRRLLVRAFRDHRFRLLILRFSTFLSVIVLCIAAAVVNEAVWSSGQWGGMEDV